VLVNIPGKKVISSRMKISALEIRKIQLRRRSAQASPQRLRAFSDARHGA
jgi:hypothetical protein